jgi:DNA-binding response OmpR family regulator
MDSKLNILLVEDHESLRRAIARVLGDNGHRVFEVSCAEEVAEIAGGYSIDLFILDLNLPGMDGLVLTSTLRKSHPNVGIIILSARSGSDHQTKGFRMGADLYLTKPIAPSTLLAAIDSVARRLNRPIEPLEGLQLNMQALKLSGSAGNCLLSSAEAALLLGFVRAPDHRLDFDEIMRLVEPSGKEFTKASIEVRVVRLRKKLQSAGASSDCIRSIRQRGYQFCELLTVVA